MSTNVDYLAYLESPEWWHRRRAALQRANYRCEREDPNGPRHEGPLDVHHRSYQHLGNEMADELEVLCRPCHRAEHQPRNRALRSREGAGQQRLFNRWDAPSRVVERIDSRYCVPISIGRKRRRSAARRGDCEKKR